MAYAWLGEGPSPLILTLFRMLMLFPLLLPFFLFVSLQLMSVLVHRKRIHATADVENSISIKANEIAQWMDMSPIKYIIDPDFPSPYADIRGIIPTRILAYPPYFQLFFDHYPRHAEAVIAHELAHIKYHIQKTRRLRVLSKLSLAGTGFLSILTNTIKNEKEADEFAERYLAEHDLDKRLLDEAIDKISAMHYAYSNLAYDNLSSVSPFIKLVASTKEKKTDNNSIWHRITNSFKVFCTFYVNTEKYDYLHRQGRLP